MSNYNSKNVFLLGYSGHSFVVIDAILESHGIVVGYFELKEKSENPYKLRFLGNDLDEDVVSIVGGNYIFPAVGSNKLRRQMVLRIEKYSLRQLVVVDRTAQVSKRAKIGFSSFIGPRAVVNAMSEIGNGCIINTSSVIEHQCKISHYSHVAPGAILAGNVMVGEETFIGAGAIIKQGVHIGNRAIVGAGAVVLKDVPDGETWIGVPAKRMKNV